MSAYKDKNTEVRMASAGDIAEKQFERWYQDTYHRKPYRYGLHGDAPYTGVPFVQATPDYLGRDLFYEVQGVGKDRMVKVKTAKVLALQEWSYHLPVRFWFFDAVDRRWSGIHLPDLYYLLEHDSATGRYPEGAEYRALSVTRLRWYPVSGWVESDWHDEG